MRIVFVCVDVAVDGERCAFCDKHTHKHRHTDNSRDMRSDERIFIEHIDRYHRHGFGMALQYSTRPGNRIPRFNPPALYAMLRFINL